jgi:hypothetical protein
MNPRVEGNASSLYLETLGREQAREKIFGYLLSAQHHISFFLTSKILHLKEQTTLSATFQTSASILRS